MSPTVGWAINGRPGFFVCPVHRKRGVEVQPISLTSAEAAGLTCAVCGERLARATRPVRTGGRYTR